mgnify:FL=1
MRRRTTAATHDRRTTVAVGERLAWNCARMAADCLNYFGTSYQSGWENCRCVSGGRCWVPKDAVRTGRGVRADLT